MEVEVRYNAPNMIGQANVAMKIPEMKRENFFLAKKRADKQSQGVISLPLWN